jgi:hypothetical protein
VEAYSLHLPDTYNSTHRQRKRGWDPREVTKLGKKNQEKLFFFLEHEVKKGGAGDCCDVAQTDKVRERDCGRRCRRQKGQSVIDKRNTRNEKNVQTQHERDTAADMDEARADGDDDDEGGNYEDEDGEYGDGVGSAGDRTGSYSKRRQDRSFYFTTGVVKRMQAKEDGSLTATCQVGGHAQCRNIIRMTNGDTQGVAQHFLKYHTDLNVRIRDLKVLF